MNHLPRIALGTVHTHADLHCLLWALLNVLEQADLQVQSFSSQSRCDARDASLAITGQGRRHLDSWLMPPDVCAELFYHGSRYADIGVVDGRFDTADVPGPRGGSLDTLCSWLDLPQVAVIHAGGLEPCRLPILPAAVDAILLDEVWDIHQLCRVQTLVEGIYGVPVLGALHRIAHLRAAVAHLGHDSRPSPELCHALGAALAPHFRLAEFLELASRRLFGRVAGGLFRERVLTKPVRIAVAHDEAFSHHFPDTLDLLESQGATVNVFSPLRSESLPQGTDVVYLGCGQLERHVNELAANVCIKESLWRHVAGGGRVYAESAGLAYLCREVVMPGGGHWSMVGLLPALARRHPHPPPEQAVEVCTARSSWLFPARATVRGYLDSKWIIHPDGCLADGCLVPLVSEAEHSHDMVGDDHVVGSRIHLNFAARPDCVDRFLQPRERVPLNTVS